MLHTVLKMIQQVSSIGTSRMRADIALECEWLFKTVWNHAVDGNSARTQDVALGYWKVTLNALQTWKKIHPCPDELIEHEMIW